jgi:hypothetical protein
MHVWQLGNLLTLRLGNRACRAPVLDPLLRTYLSSKPQLFGRHRVTSNSGHRRYFPLDTAHVIGTCIKIGTYIRCRPSIGVQCYAH